LKVRYVKALVCIFRWGEQCQDDGDGGERRGRKGSSEKEDAKCRYVYSVAGQESEAGWAMRMVIDLRVVAGKVYRTLPVLAESCRPSNGLALNYGGPDAMPRLLIGPHFFFTPEYVSAAMKLFFLTSAFYVCRHICLYDSHYRMKK
jgi:hypothetical protein